MKKKVLVIIYNIERAKEHEWFIENLSSQFQIEYILINKPGSFFEKFLKQHDIPVYNVRYEGKRSAISCIYSIYKIVKRGKYDIVHAHLFEATIYGMIAAKLAGVKCRIITRHNSDFHHVYFPGAVKYDKLAAGLAHKVIAVSDNVKNILVEKEGVEPGKVVTIPHGIYPEEFSKAAISSERIESLRKKYDIPEGKTVIGVVSRFIYWKGLQFIIPAFKAIHDSYPETILVLANAQGPYEIEVLELVNELAPGSFRLIKFEEDIPALFQTFSIFVHTPVSATAEAFGQTYIEALAAEIPSVITKSGVAMEYAADGENCIVASFESSVSVELGIRKLLDRNIDIQKMIQSGLQIVDAKYRAEDKYKRIGELYNNCHG